VSPSNAAAAAAASARMDTLHCIPLMAAASCEVSSMYQGCSCTASKDHCYVCTAWLLLLLLLLPSIQALT
jgi:hypothetical protein